MFSPSQHNYGYTRQAKYQTNHFCHPFNSIRHIIFYGHLTLHHMPILNKLPFSIGQFANSLEPSLTFKSSCSLWFSPSPKPQIPFESGIFYPSLSPLCLCGLSPILGMGDPRSGHSPQKALPLQPAKSFHLNNLIIPVVVAQELAMSSVNQGKSPVFLPPKEINLEGQEYGEEKG